MSNYHYLACDLGAESGRVMLGTLASGKIYLEEIHRFPNLPVRLGNSIRWDILGMFREMKKGLSMVAARGLDISSLSVDSWGVDYVWGGAGQPMLALPFIYRDERIEMACKQALQRVSSAEIFSQTGLQFMPFNTVYQLFADHRDSPELVRIADGFLLIADFYNYLFSGVRKAEESMASTTQLYNPRTRSWSLDLIASFGYRSDVFPEIVPSATVLGPLLPVVQEETGLGDIQVVATCSHDTGAAVASVPAEDTEDWAFLSSGTWSLIGVELPAPLINEQVREANYTNEGGYGGTSRFLKNIVGLWILQECRRAWEKEGKNFTYEELTNLAAEAEPLQILINPDDPRFVKPGEMPARIIEFCKETGQPEPSGPGQIARCILESLALVYSLHLDLLESLTGKNIRTLHIVGGGSKSALLNQFAANATRRTVCAGPTEATAIGNILLQAIANGHLDSLTTLRKTVRNSFSIAQFQPEDAAAWQDAAVRFVALRNR